MANKLLPCDSDGVCMVCNQKPPSDDTLTCGTCATPWHLHCLPASLLSDASQWECPDCSDSGDHSAPLPPPSTGGNSGEGILAEIRKIQSDTTLTDQEKAKKRQELMGGAAKAVAEEQNTQKTNNVLDIFDGSLNCSFCMQLPERPVTTPCGHNFCLKCFEKWVAKGKRSCANCRRDIPSKMASQPRINAQLAIAIRLARLARSDGDSVYSREPKFYHSADNDDRPDTAFTTERAKKTGKANACSGKIFVTIPSDHFGPIPAENDPKNKRGVLVGDTWEDRLECRQWGAHFPHVAGIAGQSGYGAQSVALSGGYIDDEDHGEWFLYTGSGGRDLSGNKRTNKHQSFDQRFESGNEALRVSCRRGYPVRVVRSHKEKRSSYAPDAGVRYDGVYRIEKCWRKNGVDGVKVCRYLFVRCDNEPAPWTSDTVGDRPRPLPNIKELKNAIDITERKEAPAWDYDEEKGCWLWKRPPPPSQKSMGSAKLKTGTKVSVVRKSKKVSIKEKLVKEFGCLLCRKVLAFPLTTPCGHNFCKACLEGAFSGQSITRERKCEGGRQLRERKNIMKCPSCSYDIADYLKNPQVNREMMGIIESLQHQAEQEENSEVSSDKNDENLKDVHDVAEVSKPCDSGEKVLEEIKDNVLNRPNKRRKGAGGVVMENTEEHVEA